MVRAPEPELIGHHVVAVDRDAHVVPARRRAAGPRRQVEEEGGVGGMIGRGARGAHLHEVRGADRAGIENEAGDRHAIDVGDRDGRPALRRDQRGDAKAQDDRVGPGDPQRVIERVNARGEQDVLAGGQCGVHAGDAGRSRLGDIELIDRGGLAQLRAGGPTDAPAVSLQRRHEDGVSAGAVDSEEGLLADDGSPVHDRVGRIGELTARGVDAADEDHVPHPVAPARPLAVARQPLLLGGGDDLAVDDRVGEETAAGPARVPPRVEVEEMQLALDVQPP